MHDYWHRQTDQPLFPAIEWAKPEQRSLAGKLAIIGGNGQSFALPVQAHSSALKAGIGQCRVILPDAVKSIIDGQGLDCMFVPSTKTGGMSKDALNELKAYAAWADTLLLIGDTGRNAETAIVHEQLMQLPRPIVATRDAVDLVRQQADQWLHRQDVTLVVTFAQLQKIFQTVHYPKILLFSMQVAQLVEILHKFTISYPVNIVTMHQGQLIVASDGEVSTTSTQDNLAIWRGTIATCCSVYLTHAPERPFQALTTAIFAATSRY